MEIAVQRKALGVTSSTSKRQKSQERHESGEVFLIEGYTFYRKGGGHPKKGRKVSRGRVS